MVLSWEQLYVEEESDWNRTRVSEMKDMSKVRSRVAGGRARIRWYRSSSGIWCVGNHQNFLTGWLW